MWRGFLLSWRYSMSCWSDRCRPNHVFHQKRKGIKTMSHPVTKKRIFCVREIERLGLTDDAVTSSELDWFIGFSNPPGRIERHREPYRQSSSRQISQKTAR